MKYLFAVGLLLIALGAYPSPTDVPADLQRSRVVAMTQWFVNGEESQVIAAVVLKNDITRLQFFCKADRNWRNCGDFEIGDIALNLTTTSEQGGYLVSQWVTGSGYVTKIFEYPLNAPMPKLVLEVGSKGLPDLIYSPTGEYEFAIVVRTDEKGVGARGSTEDTAAIYKLKAGQTVNKSVVSWARRFDGLAR